MKTTEEKQAIKIAKREHKANNISHVEIRGTALYQLGRIWDLSAKANHMVKSM